MSCRFYLSVLNLEESIETCVKLVVASTRPSRKSTGKDRYAVVQNDIRFIRGNNPDRDNEAKPAEILELDALHSRFYLLADKLYRTLFL